MSFVLRRKASFLVPSGPKDLLHLHVVLTNGDADGFHLVATVGSIKEGMNYDPACVIEPGEHSFITVRSFVIYALTEPMRSVHVTAMTGKN